MAGDVPMSKDVTLNLDDFGRHALQRLAREGNGSITASVRTALLYYLADRDAGRPASVPRFTAERQAGHSESVAIDDETWDALSDESERQAVSVERLIEHAVMYFLADVDSGRVAGRLKSRLDRPDG